MPQIEVKFDIDADGILNVSAKDLGTSKEQTVRIEQSSGLNEEAIERMRKDGEAHAEEDKKRRELIEARNEAESRCYQLEKLMKEHEAKLGEADKGSLEAAIQKTRDAAAGDDVQAIKSAISELEAASHALSKTLYEAAGAGAGAAAGPAGGSTTDASGGSSDDDAIDAEFEVKDS
jgi:molecular chaperone DnaK